MAPFQGGQASTAAIVDQPRRHAGRPCGGSPGALVSSSGRLTHAAMPRYCDDTASVRPAALPVVPGLSGRESLSESEHGGCRRRWRRPGRLGHGARRAGRHLGDGPGAHGGAQPEGRRPGRCDPGLGLAGHPGRDRPAVRPGPLGAPAGGDRRQRRLRRSLPPGREGRTHRSERDDHPGRHRQHRGDDGLDRASDRQPVPARGQGRADQPASLRRHGHRLV